MGSKNRRCAQLLQNQQKALHTSKCARQLRTADPNLNTYMNYAWYSSISTVLASHPADPGSMPKRGCFILTSKSANTRLEKVSDIFRKGLGVDLENGFGEGVVTTRAICISCSKMYTFLTPIVYFALTLYKMQHSAILPAISVEDSPPLVPEASFNFLGMVTLTAEDKISFVPITQPWSTWNSKKTDFQISTWGITVPRKRTWQSDVLCLDRLEGTAGNLFPNYYGVPSTRNVELWRNVIGTTLNIFARSFCGCPMTSKLLRSLKRVLGVSVRVVNTIVSL